MPPLAIPAYTATTALGRGREAQADALRARRGGLRRNDFGHAALDTWIGRVDGLEQVPLPERFMRWECRNNRLAWLALQQDGMLDAIAETYKAKGLAVLTVSQDSGEQGAITAFFAKNRLPHLGAWRDPENQLGFHFATGLLPTTVLYDREGKEVARVAGAMDWSSARGSAMIDDLVE